MLEKSKAKKIAKSILACYEEINRKGMDAREAFAYTAFGLTSNENLELETAVEMIEKSINSDDENHCLLDFRELALQSFLWFFPEVRPNAWNPEVFKKLTEDFMEGKEYPIKHRDKITEGINSVIPKDAIIDIGKIEEHKSELNYLL